MTDDLVPSEPQAPPPAGDEPEGRTAEAVEAEYRARLSGKDKAHAAEKAVYEARIASLEAEKTQKVGTQMDELTTLREQNARLAADKAQSDAEKAQAVIEARKARFPNAADSLGDDLVSSIDEGRLTELETRLAGAAQPSGGQMLSDQARRPAGEPTRDPRDKTVAELEADLAKYGSGVAFSDRQ